MVSIYYYYYFFIFCCVLIWNIQTKTAFWNFDVFLAGGIGQWVPASPIALTLPVGLLPRWVSWPLAWGSIACLGCQKIFTCETRVLHSTLQSLTYWFLSLIQYWCCLSLCICIHILIFFSLYLEIPSTSTVPLCSNNVKQWCWSLSIQTLPFVTISKYVYIGKMVLSHFDTSINHGKHLWLMSTPVRILK